MINRKIIVGLCFFVLMCWQSRLCVAVEPKVSIGPKQYESLQVSLLHKHWVVRAHAATKAQTYSDAKVLQTLLNQLKEEKHVFVQTCLISAISTWSKKDLHALWAFEDLDKTIEKLWNQRTQSSHSVLVSLVQCLTATNKTRDAAWHLKLWRLKAKHWKKKQADAVLAWEQENGVVSDLLKGEQINKKARLLVPRLVLEYLDHFKHNGLNFTLLFGEHVSLVDHRHKLLKRLGAVARACVDLSSEQKFKIGVLSYGGDGLTTIYDLTDDLDLFEKRLPRLGTVGDAALFVPLHRIMEQSIKKFSWDKKAFKHMVIFGARETERVHKATCVQNIKAAVTDDMMLHFFGVNQGSNNAPRLVSGYSDFATAGGGRRLIVMRDTDVATELLLSVFGKKSDDMREFCRLLVMYHSPVEKSRKKRR